MERIKTILRDIMPCWYELSWLEKIPAILLRVHKDFVEEIKERKIDFEKAPMVMGLKLEFGFKNFVGDFNGNFGFDDVFKRKGEKDGFIEFLIKIPKVKKKTDKSCSCCKGKGKTDFAGIKKLCLSCDGKGKEYIYDWRSPYAISGSLNVFFTLAAFPKKDTCAPNNQLMDINLRTTRGGHGGSLRGDYSIFLAEWFNSCDKEKTATQIKQATMRAYRRMFEMSSFDRYKFDTRVNNGGVFISCPGDATGIHPDGYRNDKNEGREFSCHNVDTPMQQLILLVGLAALHDIVRKEIK